MELCNSVFFSFCQRRFEQNIDPKIRGFLFCHTLENVKYIEDNVDDKLKDITDKMTNKQIVMETNRRERLLVQAPATSLQTDTAGQLHTRVVFNGSVFRDFGGILDFFCSFLTQLGYCTKKPPVRQKKKLKFLHTRNEARSAGPFLGAH